MAVIGVSFDSRRRWLWSEARARRPVTRRHRHRRSWSKRAGI